MDRERLSPRLQLWRFVPRRGGWASWYLCVWHLKGHDFLLLARRPRRLGAWVTLRARGPGSLLTSGHGWYLGGCLLTGTRGGGVHAHPCTLGPMIPKRSWGTKAAAAQWERCPRLQGLLRENSRRLLPPQTTPPPGPGPPAPAAGRPGLVVGPDSPWVPAAPSGHSQMRHIQAANPIKRGAGHLLCEDEASEGAVSMPGGL